jgi:hypothetical protein
VFWQKASFLSIIHLKVRDAQTADHPDSQGKIKNYPGAKRIEKDRARNRAGV